MRRFLALAALVIFFNDVHLLPFFFDISSDNFTFSEGLPDLYEGSFAWEDFNRDGLPDVILTGRAGGEFVFHLFAQQSEGEFTDVTNNDTFPGGPPPGVFCSDVEWADYDNDGLPDFIYSGMNLAAGPNPYTLLYKQTSPGVFEDVTNLAFDPPPPGTFLGGLAWADFNQDGNLDLLITGNTLDPLNPRTTLYRQTENHTFIDVRDTASPSLPNLLRSSVAWGDINNDTLVDFVVAGQRAGWPREKLVALFLQSPSGGFVESNSTLFASVNNTPTGVDLSTVSLLDINDDGRVDLLITGENTAGNASTELFFQLADGTLELQTNTGLPDVHGGSVSFGDADLDGRTDILMFGLLTPDPFAANVSASTGIFIQQNDSSFLDVAQSASTFPLHPPPPGLFFGTAAWHDYNSDGVLDIMICGYDGAISHTRIYTAGCGGTSSGLYFEDNSTVLSTLYNISNGGANLTAACIPCPLGEVPTLDQIECEPEADSDDDGTVKPNNPDSSAPPLASTLASMVEATLSSLRSCLLTT